MIDPPMINEIKNDCDFPCLCNTCLKARDEEIGRVKSHVLQQFGEKIIGEIEKNNCKCKCSCEFKDGCLCIGDREGYNEAKSDITQMVKEMIK